MIACELALPDLWRDNIQCVQVLTCAPQTFFIFSEPLTGLNSMLMLLFTCKLSFTACLSLLSTFFKFHLKLLFHSRVPLDLVICFVLGPENTVVWVLVGVGHATQSLSGDLCLRLASVLCSGNLLRGGLWACERIGLILQGWGLALSAVSLTLSGKLVSPITILPLLKTSHLFLSGLSSTTYSSWIWCCMLSETVDPTRA